MNTTLKFNPTAILLNDFTRDYLRNLVRVKAGKSTVPLASDYLCPDCADPMILTLLSTDADGHRAEYKYVCVHCD